MDDSFVQVKECGGDGGGVSYFAEKGYRVRISCRYCSAFEVLLLFLVQSAIYAIGKLVQCVMLKQNSLNVKES